ncbi:MAG: hypothetical protein GX451_09770 [Acholeplasmataceae bacterium]|nr:hypothetical protein [Acholeplasmataceae bacterium]
MIRVKAGRNLLLPVVKDFDNMGLRRAHRYDLLTYEELLEKHGIENSLVAATSDYAKKVYNYARGEVFLVPSGIPLQDWEPIRENGRARAISVGREGLLEKFAQLFYTANWVRPENGSIGQYLDNLNSMPEQPDEGYEAKVLEWTNKYGLLFSEPIPQSLIENIYEPSYLPFSDAFYNHICAEKINIPYFLGLSAFCELNRYTLKLLFLTWLYSELDALGVADEEIIRAYGILSPQRTQGYNEYIKWKAGNEAPENVRHYYLKGLAVTEISRHVSMWIKLEMASHIKEDTSGAKFAVYPQYQCSSLFATMMIEALSGLNNASRYRVCKKCKNLFDIGNGRSDRKYCSEECKELARYRREQENREREREARRSQN